MTLKNDMVNLIKIVIPMPLQMGISLVIVKQETMLSILQATPIFGLLLRKRAIAEPGPAPL